MQHILPAGPTPCRAHCYPLLAPQSYTQQPTQSPALPAVLSANETSEAQSLVEDILDAALNVSRFTQFLIARWLAQGLGLTARGLPWGPALHL